MSVHQEIVREEEDTECRHKIGDLWTNVVSGLEYRWDGERWVAVTGPGLLRIH